MLIINEPSAKKFKLGLAAAVLGVAVAFLGFYGYVGASTLKKIVHQDGQSANIKLFFPNIGQKLKGEENHRVNILLVGIGGGKHPGGLLADTIILSSIQSQNKQVALLSIPRDLLVPLPKPLAGFDKINATHSIGEREKSTGGGIAYLKKTVTEVFDQPIHYVMRIDFVGFKKIIDTLGGITVTVEKPIYDPLYPAPNMVDYEPFSIQAGSQTLTGEVALKYARSRETTSDFDRARRQQQILQAIREKTLSLNVLANPKKIWEIAKIVGDHFKTDLSPWEVERLIAMVKEVPQDQVLTKVLDTTSDGPLVSVNEGGYYLKPKDGTYQQLKKIAEQVFVPTPMAQEKAKIEIINATSVDGAGTKLAEELTESGLTISRISRQSTRKHNFIHDLTGGKKPATVKLLLSKIKGGIVSSSPVEWRLNDPADIVIILGDDS